jgi:FAM91 C-terminus
VPREAGPGGGAKPDAAAGREGGGAVAVVVDAEVTGLLMMGALSPGLKRHSVSLFEGAAPLQAQLHGLTSAMFAGDAAACARVLRLWIYAV